MIKKAFMLHDVLIYLFIICVLSLSSIIYFNKDNNNHYDFIDDYYHKQIDSYINKRINYISDYGLHFNESGNINMAKTLYFDNHRVIIHLGNGYLTYE